MAKIKEEVLDEKVQSISQPEHQECTSLSAKEKLQQLIKEESRTVKGRFRFHECPGGSTKIQCSKYPGVPMFSQVMVDGEIYSIPLWVARWMNGVDVSAGALSGNGNAKINSCAVPQHAFTWNDRPPECVMDQGGKIVPMVSVNKWTPRMSFESMEFDIG